MTKKKSKPKPLSDSDYQLMLSSKRNILHGKRLWRFYEGQFYFSLIFVGLLIGALIRIYKVGVENYILLILVIIPPFLTYLMIIYRRSELRFLEVVTNKSSEENYILIKESIRLLNWRIEKESPRDVEAFTGQGLGLTWGDEMITAIIADNLILINCQCNLDYYKTQNFFTFGKLTRIAKKLKTQIESKT